MQHHVGYRGIADSGVASARQIYGFMDWMHRPPPAPRLLDGYWERNLQPWDIAAGQIMVREAGGDDLRDGRQRRSAEDRARDLRE